MPKWGSKKARRKPPAKKPIRKSAWEEAKRLFHEAQELDAKKRKALLARVRKRRPDVAAELESLLAASDVPESFLESSIAEDLARLSQARNTSAKAPTVVAKAPEPPPTVHEYKSLKTGDVLADHPGFDLLRRLGSGGVAEVYLARRRGPGGFEKRIAVKRLLGALAEDRGFLELFAYEARLSSRLAHPNIAQVFDFVFADGHYWLAMEFVDGKNLSQLLRRLEEKGERLSPEVAALIAADVCRGLDYAHRLVDERTGRPLGIVHRDVSPKNVMIGYDGEVKLVDFGIANARDRARVTATGDLRGTIPYMSPEQARGERLGPGTDIYSAGVVLFEALTGESWRASADPVATLREIQAGEDAPGRLKKLAMPRNLKQVLRLALGPKPEDRYPDAAAMAGKLSAYLAEFGEGPARERLRSLMQRLFAEDIETERRVSEGPPIQRAVFGISNAPPVLRRPLSPVAALLLLMVTSLAVAGAAMRWHFSRSPVPLELEAWAPERSIAENACGSHFDSSPSGAQLALNGIVVGTTPLATEMPCNVPVDVEMTLPAHDSIRYQARARGRQGRVHVTLLPARRTGVPDASGGKR